MNEALKIMDEIEQHAHSPETWGKKWQSLRTALEAQAEELTRRTDHLHKMAREQTGLRHEVKRLTEELSQTKKDVTDAELAWQSTDWWFERYKSWPEDIRRKLSLYDLRRMTGWRPPFEREAKEQDDE